MMSFFRSTIVKKPSRSRRARSPVYSQPPRSARLVSRWIVEIALHDLRTSDHQLADRPYRQLLQTSGLIHDPPLGVGEW